MKNLIPIILVIAAAAFLSGNVPRAFADTVNAGDTITLNWAFAGQSSQTNGGPFILNDITTGDQFLSFCLEKDEYFTPGAPMIIDSIGPAAYMGGLGGPEPDPISMETAWLYRHFREGDLWAILGIAGPENSDYYRLQSAIWFYEQELGSISGNVFVDYLSTHTVASSNDFDYVHVINPVSSSGALKQSQLTYFHAPEPGSLALLGTGMAALGLALRRKKK